MNTVRIAHREGLRMAECVERVGDWAITRNDVGKFVITHLPTGCAIPDDDYDMVELRWLIERLNGLPRMDMQSLDVEAIRQVLNP